MVVFRVAYMSSRGFRKWNVGLNYFETWLYLELDSRGLGKRNVGLYVIETCLGLFRVAVTKFE